MYTFTSSTKARTKSSSWHSPRSIVPGAECVPHTRLINPRLLSQKQFIEHLVCAKKSSVYLRAWHLAPQLFPEHKGKQGSSRRCTDPLKAAWPGTSGSKCKCSSLKGLERPLEGKRACCASLRTRVQFLSSRANLWDVWRFLKTFWGCHTAFGSLLLAASGVKAEALLNIP